MKINYDRIISGRISEQVSENELSVIKAIAMDARKSIISEYTKLKMNSANIVKRVEKDIYEFNPHGIHNPTNKALLAANIVFYNNEKFVKVLLENYKFKENVDKATVIDLIVTLASYLKAQSQKNETLNANLLKHVETFVNSLMPALKAEYGEVTPEIIINKANEIVSFYPELLETRKTTKTR